MFLYQLSNNLSDVSKYTLEHLSYLENMKKLNQNTFDPVPLILIQFCPLICVVKHDYLKRLHEVAENNGQ